MALNSLNFLSNALKIKKQKKYFIVQSNLSNKSIAVLSILLKEGFIRGYFFGLNKNKKIIFILLKQIDNNNFFIFEGISLNFQKEYFSKKYLKRLSNGFCFFIVSTQKGIASNYEVLQHK
jgi:ribosomal protein S8